MIRINLLPFRAARKKENVRRQVMIFSLSVILVLGGLGWYHLSLGGKVAAMEQKVEDTQTELQTLEKKLNEIKRIRSILDTIRRKTAVIEDLELGREAAVRLLDAMTRLVIKNQMHLTQLKVNGNELTMNGVAADNQTIADYLLRLENAGLFDKVVLKSTQAKTSKGGTSLQQFGITCQAKPLQRPEKTDKKTKSRKKAAKK